MAAEEFTTTRKLCADHTFLFCLTSKAIQSARENQKLTTNMKQQKGMGEVVILTCFHSPTILL